jgi:type II secretory pathway pseudopilin PulG
MNRKQTGGTKRGVERFHDERGLTLIELVVSVCIIIILTACVLPLAKITIKRTKEIELRRNLRMIRQAIDDFHKSYQASQYGPLTGQPGGTGSLPGRASQPLGGVGGFGSQPSYPGGTTGYQSGTAGIPGRTMPGQPGYLPGSQQGTGVGSNIPGLDPTIPLIDISRFDPVDCKGYPPTLEILVEGVPAYGSPDELVKFMRRIPRDPMTESGEWDLRSFQDPSDAIAWGHQNVYDIRSRSNGVGLDGTNYRDW